jgi:hypothetical protein
MACFYEAARMFRKYNPDPQSSRPDHHFIAATLILTRTASEPVQLKLNDELSGRTTALVAAGIDVHIDLVGLR